MHVDTHCSTVAIASTSTRLTVSRLFSTFPGAIVVEPTGCVPTTNPGPPPEVVKSRSVVVANVVVGMPSAGAGPHCSKHRIGSDNSDSQQSGNNSWTPSLYAESRSLHAGTPKSREHSFKQQLKHSIFSSANGPQVYRH